jgi:hypothetical protein
MCCRLAASGRLAEGPAVEEHCALLLHAVGMGRHAGAHPPRGLRSDERTALSRRNDLAGVRTLMSHVALLRIAALVTLIAADRSPSYLL